MSPQDVLSCVQALPFRPFCIRMNRGRTFEIRDPERGRIGRRDLLIFTFVSDSPKLYAHWKNVSLLRIESLALLETSVA